MFISETTKIPKLLQSPIWLYPSLNWTQGPTISWLPKHRNCTPGNRKPLKSLQVLSWHLNLIPTLSNPVNPPQLLLFLQHSQMVAGFLFMSFFFPLCHFHNLCTWVRVISVMGPLAEASEIPSLHIIISCGDNQTMAMRYNEDYNAKIPWVMQECG